MRTPESSLLPVLIALVAIVTLGLIGSFVLSLFRAILAPLAGLGF